ncbi:MAG: ABC transporter substrate-binding protein [Planctomycetota bacterium]|jgi:peptide/nickel transport system substrate-binding protein
MRTLSLSLTLLLAVSCSRKKEGDQKLDVTRLLGEAPSVTSPEEGGTFIWGRSADATKLDPAAVTDGESVQVITNLFDTLVTFKPGTTEIVPWLATKWTPSSDQLTWTFKLREDVRFHDGSDFNAAAVVFSFARQQHKDHPARRPDDEFSYFHNNFKALDRVEVEDDFTVRFVLKVPYAPFLSALALFSCGIVSPTAFESEGRDAGGRCRYNFAQKPVGTGPFVFEKWEKDSHIILRANKAHFSGPPPIDKLIFKPIKDPQARLKELEAGSIHGMDNPSLEDLQGAHRHPRLRLLSRPGINVCYLAMHTQKKPFDDVRVRQAVAFAIDKRRLIAAAYNGMAEPAVSMCPKSMTGHHVMIDRVRNPKRARELLKAAGLRKGFVTTLWYGHSQRTYLPNPGNTAIQIQQDLKEIGVEVKLKKMEWSAYLSATQNGQHEMCLLGWMADIFDPDNFLYVLLDKDNAVPGVANNVSFYRGERVHQRLIEAQRSYAWHVRKRLYKEAQEILLEEVPVIPLATVPDFRILRREVRGYTIYPAGGEYFRHVSFAR